MLERMPYIEKRKRRFAMLRRLLWCVVWWCVCSVGIIVLCNTTAPDTEMPADGEYLYNRYLFVISITYISAFVGLYYFIRILRRT